MKLISWNVSGAARKSFCGQVKIRMPKYNPDVIAFMETRLNSIRARKIIERLNWPKFVEIPPLSLPKVFLEGDGFFEKIMLNSMLIS